MSAVTTCGPDLLLTSKAYSLMGSVNVLAPYLWTIRGAAPINGVAEWAGHRHLKHPHVHHGRVNFLPYEAFHLRGFCDILQQINDLVPTTHFASDLKFTISGTERTERIGPRVRPMNLLDDTRMSDESPKSLIIQIKLRCFVCELKKQQ